MTTLKDKVKGGKRIEYQYFDREDVKEVVLEFRKQIDELETENIKYVHTNTVKHLIEKIFGDFTDN